jgi:hypothetical protein
VDSAEGRGRARAELWHSHMLVKQIFARYLVLGSVRLLKKELDRRGIISPRFACPGKGSKSGASAKGS